MSGKFASKDWTAGESNALIKNLGEENARKIQRGEKFDLKFEGNEYFTLLKSSLKLPATDGTRLISQAKDVFTGYIDPDFVNWKANETSQPTAEMKVSVHEMKKNGTYKQLFNSLGNPEDLCLTQDQIISFVENHRDHLRKDGYGTFFLFKSNNEIFVASVDVRSDGQLRVNVVRFGHSHVWLAGRRHRLVALQ